MNKILLTLLNMALLVTISAAQEDTGPDAEQPVAEEASVSLKIYDVADIVMLDPPGTAASAFNKAEAKKRTARLAEMIRKYMQPRLDQDRHDVKNLGDGTIVVTAMAEQHAWVREFLEVQRRERDTFVLIEIEFFKAPIDLGKVLTQGEGPEFFNVKSAAEKKRIVDEIKAMDGVEFQTRNFVAYQRADSTLSLVKKISYVSGFTIHEDVEPMKNRLVCPVVQTIDDGIELDARVTLLAGNRFGVEISFVDTEVIEIEPIRTEHGEFGMPNFAQTKGNGTLILTKGSTVFLTAQYRDQVVDGRPEFKGKLVLITLKKVYSKN